MRRSAVATVLVLLAIAGAPPTAEAQFLRFGVGAGTTTPVGDFSNITRAGFQLQGLVALRPPVLPVSVRGEALFHRLPGDEFGSFQQLAGVVNGVYTLLPVPLVSPYLIGGVGIYSGSFSDAGSRTDFGVNAGAGLRVNLMVLEGFLEGRYHQVLNGAGSPRVVPITLGIMF